MQKYFAKYLNILLIVFIITSCTAPNSKEKYFEKYKSFIDEVNTDYKTYTDDHWTKIEEKYNKFNNEWYQKFEPELLFKEKLTVYKYQYQYNSIKIKSGLEQIYDKHLKEDFTMLFNKMKEYIDESYNNQAQADSAKMEIEQIEKYAEDASDSVMVGILTDMLNDLQNNK